MEDNFQGGKGLIAAAAVYNEHYRPLAELTLFENRKRYCEKNGYAYYFKKFDIELEDDYARVGQMSFEKVRLILSIFRDSPQTMHVWMGDVDGMVMNMDARLEEIIQKYPSEIVTGSDYNGLSTGCFICQNTQRVKDYLNELWEKRAAYLHEQLFFWENPRSFIFKTPQRVMNSHDTTLPFLNPAGLDVESAQFQSGDFFMHWPAQTLNTRIRMYEKWKGAVIDK